MAVKPKLVEFGEGDLFVSFWITDEKSNIGFGNAVFDTHGCESCGGKIALLLKECEVIIGKSLSAFSIISCRGQGYKDDHFLRRFTWK